MKKEYIVFHKSVVNLASEINKAVDDYWSRELSEIELKEFLWKVAATGKLFKANEFNKTITRLCGKARMEIVEELLKGYQSKF